MPTRAIACVGAAHWDVIARAGAPLVPGADVPGRIERRRPGGVAANVALALAARGRSVSLVTAVGADEPGDRLLDELRARGIDCDGVMRLPGPTGYYLAIEAASGELFAAVADCALLDAAAPALPARLRLAGSLRPFARIVVDGNLPAVALAELLLEPAPLALAVASPAKAALLPDIAAVRPKARTTLYLNRREAEAICGRRFPDSRAAAAALLARGVSAVVTDGAAPATAVAPGRMITIAPPGVAAGSSTGAGDVLLAAHIDALDAGRSPEAALRAALVAAAAHVAGSAA